MGYVRQAKVYKLVFDDPDMNGLVVRARSVPMNVFLSIAQAAEGVDITDPEAVKELATPENMGMVGTLFEAFAHALVEWNLQEQVEDDGPVVDVPPTLEGIYSQDMDFILKVIEAWMTAIAGVSNPLAGSSPGGKQSLEASIPMETSSPSLAS